MFLLFLFMALRYWSDNKIQAYDREWGKHMSDFINNRDDALPPIDKYNIGQKQFFWVQVACMFLLIASGVILWRPYFAGLFPIPLIRIAAVVHAAAGFVLIIAVIVHAYAAFWVKGTLRAMLRGTVSHAWARHHHPLWYRRITGNTK